MRRHLLFALLLPTVATAQLAPVQTYNGIRRPLEVDARPRGAAKKLEVLLYRASGDQPIARAEVRAGRLDLAETFSLWSEKSPTLLYAQLVADGAKLGSALVLQPMLNPAISRLKPDGKTVEFVADEDGPMFNGYRVYLDQHLAIETSMGTMEFRLRPDAAPNTAWNIRELARGGLYDDTIFHRVVAKRPDGSPFVIQGGDPTGTGSGGPGFAYPLENSTLPHTFGVISIARSTDPNTNGCQFFVALSREGTSHLDGRYAAFGECVKGAEVILKIAAVPVGAQDRPTNPPRIRRVRLINAPPHGEGPAPVVRPQG